MSSSSGVPVHNCCGAQALPRRGPLAGWAAPPRGLCGGLLTRAGGMARWAEPRDVGQSREFGFLIFPEDRNAYSFLL